MLSHKKDMTVPFIRARAKLGGNTDCCTLTFLIIECLVNRRLPEPFFVTRLPKGEGLVTTPSVDFRCKASDSYAFGTGG